MAKFAAMGFPMAPRPIKPIELGRDSGLLEDMIDVVHNSTPGGWMLTHPTREHLSALHLCCQPSQNTHSYFWSICPTSLAACGEVLGGGGTSLIDLMGHPAIVGLWGGRASVGEFLVRI